jgi:outer membrane protein assembly factor BamD
MLCITSLIRHQLGINSVPAKMEERLNVAKTAYLNLVNLMQKQNIKRKQTKC